VGGGVKTPNFPVASTLSKTLNLADFLFVCLLAYLGNHTAEPIFGACCVWPDGSIGPVLTALRSTLCISGFIYDVLSHRWLYGASCIFISGVAAYNSWYIDSKEILLNDEDHQPRTVAFCAPGAKSTIYDCPSLQVRYASRVLSRWTQRERSAVRSA